MSKIICIGELIVDIYNYGLENEKLFLGGAPCNVCCQVHKLGKDALYLSQVGNDYYGKFILNELNKIGLDTNFIRINDNFNTSLAFITLDENNDRSFTFKRDNCADLNIESSYFNDLIMNENDIFEFGSVNLASKKSYDVHLNLIKKAKINKLLIAFDVNLRFNLWESKTKLKNTVLSVIKYVDVLKCSKEEYEFLFENENINNLFKLGIKIILITDGKNPAKLYTKDCVYTKNTYDVNTIDTTGAGDSFFGGFLYKLLDNKNVNLMECLDFACKCGAYTTTGYGAISSMPTLKNLLDL